MGPEILSSTGARVWRKPPNAFSDSSSVMDKFQSAMRSLHRCEAFCLIEERRRPPYLFGFFHQYRFRSFLWTCWPFFPEN